MHVYVSSATREGKTYITREHTFGLEVSCSLVVAFALVYIAFHASAISDPEHVRSSLHFNESLHRSYRNY